MQYQYRSANTQEEEEEDSIVGDLEDIQPSNRGQIPVVDSEDESTFTDHQPQLEVEMEKPAGGVQDEGYKKCMKNLFQNIADAQEAEMSTEDVSITVEDTAGQCRRDLQYKVEIEPELETKDSQSDFKDSAFSMCKEELGGCEEAKLFMLLGAPGPKKRIVTELTSTNKNFKSLDIELMIKKHIR